MLVKLVDRKYQNLLSKQSLGRGGGFPKAGTAYYRYGKSGDVFHGQPLQMLEGGTVIALNFLNFAQI